MMTISIVIYNCCRVKKYYELTYYQILILQFENYQLSSYKVVLESPTTLLLNFIQ